MKFPKIGYIEYSKSLQHKNFEKEAIIHREAVYNYALSLTKNADDANDLFQETFLKAFKYFRNFTSGSNCKAWLFMITKNTFINEYRKKKREPFKQSYDEIEEFYESYTPKIDDKREDADKKYQNSFGDEISSAMNSIPEKFRKVLALCDLEGYSYEEIAEYINCPIGTVRSRLHRARKMLHAKLFKYAQQHGYVERESYSGNQSMKLALQLN